MQYDYWLRVESADEPFKELEWEAPERQDQRGRLAIIGGTKLGFAGVAGAFKEAAEMGAGSVQTVMPDVLKPILGRGNDDILFAASNPSGAFSQKAEPELKAATAWADMLLLPGDNGRNSETAIALEHILQSLSTPATITRDAVDLLKADPALLIERERNVLVLSFAQLQKLLRSVYFPRGIVFSMHLSQLVETLHKVTLSYPAMIVTFHAEQLLVAHDGRVATIPFDNPMLIWRGSTATKVAVKVMQRPGKPFEAAVRAAL